MSTLAELPASVREIAEVIGVERALYLVGQLPCSCHSYRKRNGGTTSGKHVILYVPKRLPPDHTLVRLMGWPDAYRLTLAFGGEILQPANCTDVYRRFRDKSIVSMVQSGMPGRVVADMMGVSDRLVRDLMREKTQEDEIATIGNTPRGKSTGVSTMKNNMGARTAWA